VASVSVQARFGSVTARHRGSCHSRKRTHEHRFVASDSLSAAPRQSERKSSAESSHEVQSAITDNRKGFSKRWYVRTRSIFGV
jgi:hypothetical protein